VEVGLSIQSIGSVRLARSGAHSYEGAAVVGLGEASAGDGNSSGAQGLVWDHAAFPKGKAVEEGRRPTLLSPAEQVFEAVRRWVEGRRYERIEAKKAAVEAVPRRLEAEDKVSSLVGWRYICQALNAPRSCVFRKRSQYQKASLGSGQRLRRRLRGRQPPVLEFHS